MTPHYTDPAVTLHHGDCLDVLRGMANNSVDAIVTDPPAGISFMSKKWDHDLGGRTQWVAWMTEVMTEALRVIKPGGHALVWALPRTSHWTSWAIESAGFDVRDCIVHIFGSGFPKSSRVNMDVRFCQCDASARTNSHTSPAPRLGDHKHTEVDEDATASEARSVLSEKHTVRDSSLDCRDEHDLDDAPPRQQQAPDQAQSPSQGCVLGRSHSGALWDDLDAESSHSPSVALRSGHPSSQGSDYPLSSVTSTLSNTVENTSPVDTYGSVHHTPDMDLGLSSLYGTASPRCRVCDKPNATGFGTALKPASEHWWLARKPLGVSTVAGNVLRYGTGALNIDATRVGTTVETWPATRARPLNNKDMHHNYVNGGTETVTTGEPPAGRWPPNVILAHTEWCVEVGTRQVRGGTAVNGPDTNGGEYESSAYMMGSGVGGGYVGPDGAETVVAWDCPEGCPVRELDAQSGVSKSPSNYVRNVPVNEGTLGWNTEDAGSEVPGYADTGGASRFFPTFRYEAKAPTFERPGYEHKDGLQEATTVGAGMRVRQCVQCGSRGKPAGGEHSKKPWPTCGHDDWTMVETIKSANRVAHPTVKPLDLMRWLVRLVTPPGGTVLDPFAGSGTTGEACIVEGFKCVLVEREAAYLPLIVARLSKPIQPDLFGGAHDG